MEMMEIPIIDKCDLNPDYLQNLVVEVCRAAKVEPETIKQIIVAPSKSGYTVNLVTK